MWVDQASITPVFPACLPFSRGILDCIQASGSTKPQSLYIWWTNDCEYASAWELAEDPGSFKAQLVVACQPSAVSSLVHDQECKTCSGPWPDLLFEHTVWQAEAHGLVTTKTHTLKPWPDSILTLCLCASGVPVHTAVALRDGQPQHVHRLQLELLAARLLVFHTWRYALSCQPGC